MKRSFAVVALLLAFVAAGLVGAPVRPGRAQDDEAGPESTIAAQQTTIAGLQTQVAALETQAAGVPSATEVPSPVNPTEATPVVAVNGLEVLYVYAEASTYGTTFFGEVLNTTDQTAVAPSINVTLFDEQDAIVATTSLYTPLAVIPAGEKMGLDGTSDRTPDEWARLEVSVSGGGPASPSEIASEPAGVEVRNVNEVEKTDTSLRVLGELYNGETGAVGASIRAYFYRADGRYAGTMFQYGNFPSLAPGESGSFKILITVTLGPGWTYRLVPDAYPMTTVAVEAGQGVVEVVGATPFGGTPAATRSGVQLLYAYTQPGRNGGTQVFAEVRNTTDETLSSPQLHLTFYDDQDRIVDSTTFNALFGIIPPGETTPFDGIGDLPPENWARYTARLGNSEPAGTSTIAAYPKGLEIRNVTEADRTETGIQLTGEVVNAGDGSVNNANALALFYRADGRYAGSLWGYTKPPVLAPGESGAFTLVALVDAGTGWTYRLVARGTRQS